MFVLQPERTALYETDGPSTELGRMGVKAQELIENVVPPTDACE